MIAFGVLAVLVTAALGLMTSADRSVGESMALTDARRRADELLHTYRGRLLSAGAFRLGGAARSPSGAFTSVMFRPIDMTNPFDFTAGGPRLEALAMELRFEFDPGEGGAGSGDDLDNDRDGLVDEGRIELWRGVTAPLTGGARVGVMANDVASDTLAFRLRRWDPGTQAMVDDGAVATPNTAELSLTLNLLRRLPRQGGVHSVRRELRMPLRNGD